MQGVAKIDPHHHLWDLESNPYPWLQGERGWRAFGDYRAMCRSYLIDEYLTDSRPHNVVGSVHVQANWDARDPVGETRWVQTVIDTHGIPNAIVGHAALEASDLEDVLAAHAESPAFPGFPYDRSEAGIALWREGMGALARLPHCHAKLSGPCMVMRDWTVERFAPFIHETIELFGPERCMFASNVPPDALAKPYDAIYAAFYAWAERYDDAERRALFHDTAARFYRL